MLVSVEALTGRIASPNRSYLRPDLHLRAPVPPMLLHIQVEPNICAVAVSASNFHSRSHPARKPQFLHKTQRPWLSLLSLVCKVSKHQRLVAAVGSAKPSRNRMHLLNYENGGLFTNPPCGDRHDRDEHFRYTVDFSTTCHLRISGEFGGCGARPKSLPPLASARPVFI